MAIPVGLLGSAARVSLGTGSSYTLDPTAGVTGAPIAEGDFLFAEFSASGTVPRVPTPGAGWTVIVAYATFGTMAWGLWVRTRGVGETTYTGALTQPGSGDGTSVRMWWGSGHDVVTNWIIGTVFARTVTTAINVTPSITTTAVDTLAVVISTERTAAAETAEQITIDNAFAKDWVELSGGASASSLTVGHKDMAAPGGVGITSITYPNTHASNGKSLLIGIPAVPSATAEGAAVGTVAWSATATGEAPTVADASGSASGTMAWAGTVTGAHLAAGAAAGTVARVGTATGPATPVELWIADQPYYVAHRGRSAPGLQPEETLFAYAAAVAWGVKALEVSVWPSSDGVWVCSHDPTTGRVFSGASLTIASETWATLSTLTTITGGHPIARLEEVLDLYAATHIMVIEDKPAGSYPSFYAVLDDYANATGRFLIKAYMSSGIQSSEARSRGYPTWGYYFDADVDIVASYARWDYMTLNYDATQAQWDTLLATGKLVGGHVCINAANAATAFAKGAVGIMAADFETIIPFDGTAEGAAGGTVTYVGTATGGAEHGGAAAGTIAWTGSAAGAADHRGNTSGTINWAGAAAGGSGMAGDAAGSIGWAGSAAGTHAPTGEASGSGLRVGVATGTAPAVGGASGAAVGNLAWAAAAAGARSAGGAGSGTLHWAGTASGTDTIGQLFYIFDGTTMTLVDLFVSENGTDILPVAELLILTTP